MKKLLAMLLAVAMLLTTASFALAEAPVTVTIMFDGCNVTEADSAMVLAELNKYLAEKINVNVEVIWGTWGDFNDKAVTSIQGGDDIDMYFTCSWTKNEYNSFSNKGYFVRLDAPENDLLAQYGADVRAAVPEALWEGATILGSEGKGIYAVPGFKDYATQNCWDVNVTLLTELGYTVEDIQSRDFFSFGDILAKAKEVKGNDFYPLLIEPVVLERMVNNSIIVTGESGEVNALSYYINPEDVSAEGTYGNVLLNKFATPEFKAFTEKVREYYTLGYIDPSLAVAETSSDTRTNKQLNADYLIGTQSYALGYETTASAERGIEVAMVPCTDPYCDTTALQGAMVAISTVSENPEAAMKFLNIMNTDPYVMNMITYGLEGVHYELTDGLVTFTDKHNDYNTWINGMGNVTILTPTAANGEGFYETFKAYYAAGKAIPIAGFAFDYSNVETEQAAIGSVYAQYCLSLCAGAVDPATELPKFLEALDAAGMQTYVDEANAQLEAFLAK